MTQPAVCTWQPHAGQLSHHQVAGTLLETASQGRHAKPVVMEHLPAGGDDDPYVLSFRGIDNEVYYMLDSQNKSHLLNYSGCGNTTNANHPAVKQMIMDSCRR